MPGIGQGRNPYGSTSQGRPARRRQPRRVVVQPNPDQRPALRPRPAPRRVSRPSGVFGGPSTAARPFQRQQRQAAHRTRAAIRRLPAPVVAAPPVIHNPTPRQVHAAARQIATSLTRAVGPGGSNREKIARRDMIVAQVRTDPRLAQLRRSLYHWQREQAKLIRPGAFVDRVRSGPQPTRAHIGVGPLEASVNLSALSGALGRGFAAATPGLHAGTAEAQFARNALGDVKAIAEGPFIAGATIAGAGYKAATGHPAQAGSSLYQLGKGVVTSTAEMARHPGRSLREHPLISALTVLGGVGAVGRVGGAVARGAGRTEAAGVRGALARAGSTVRPSIALSEDPAGGLIERNYSKDLIHKRGQVAADRSREPLRNPNGSLVRGPRGEPILQPRSELERAHLNKRRGDTLASRANLSERLARDVASRSLKVTGIRGRRTRDVVAMVTEGTITSARHFEQDLRKHVDRLKSLIAAHDQQIRTTGHSSVFRHEGDLEYAKERVRTGEAILNSPRALAQAEKIAAAGIKHGRSLVDMERHSSAAGIIHPEQARRARLVVAAVEHMGARHGRSPILNQRIAQARRVERSLQARLNFGHHAPGERDRIQAQLEQARSLRTAIQARNTERLRDANGNPLEPEHVEAFLRSRGRDPNTVAYLPPHVSPRQFHRQFRPAAGRGSLDTAKGPRTGELHRKGGTEASARLLRAAGVRQATALTKAQQIDRAISQHGMRHPAYGKAQSGASLTKHEQKVVKRGGYYTGREAAEVIERARGRGEDLVAVRAYPARLDPEMQRHIRDDLQNPMAMELLGQRLLNNRFLTEQELKQGGTPNVVLMNKTLVDRLNAHLKPATTGVKFLQILNRAFRYAVLPQPRWLAGNFIEPLLVRMPTVGSGINVFGLAADLRAASKTIKAMERSSNPAVRAAAQEVRAHQFGGLLIGGRGQTIHRGLSDFPALQKDAQKAYGKLVATVPATRQVTQFSGLLLRHGGRALIAPLDALFHVNRAGESLLQKAAFGRSARQEVQSLTGSWLKAVRLGQQAAEEAGRGLVNTATQERFMRAQHDLLGKYEGFNPTLRGLIQTAAPFIPWALNAAKFVFWTMPAHRTTQTALLLQVNQVVSKDWQQIHKDTPPGGLRLAIPNGKGGWIDLARYTPYGLTGPIAEGDPGAIPSQFFPQFSGAESALRGKDPFGSDIQLQSGNKPGLGDEAKIAANELAEGLTPYLSTIRRLQEHGETAYTNSTAFSPKTKPGTSHGMSAVERTLYPFRPTYLSSVDQPISGSSGPPQRLSRTEQILMRRAQLLGHTGAAARTEEILRRRAQLLRHP